MSQRGDAPQRGVCRRTRTTKRIVINSVTSFTLRVSASREFVTATVAGKVTVETSGSDIKVNIAELAPGRQAKDARIYVPNDIPIVTPAGLAHLDQEAQAELAANLTEE